ncbi:MAG TPA: dihydrodipicolinate synthase family protein [Pseudonocardiaceae bacterium]|nr:dihydrodipicolinate synthase family protein [Pseudonocardiaceae bacterium]
MITDNLRGVVPPVCTPLTPDLDVDVASLTRLVDFLLDAGVHGLFVLGSTSEVAFLPDGHRQRVVETVAGHVAGQVPVLAGAIDMTTLRVLDHARAAEKAGADGIVATAPFYTRTHPAEIDRHFRLLADGLDLPIYAYDLPVSVHIKLPAELVLDLAADRVLAGLKDSSGDDGALRTILLRARELTGFSVLTGSELTVDSALHMGAHGVVPGLGNVDPHGYVRLYQHCLAGDWDAAAREQDRLVELFGLVDAGDPNRIGRGSSALGAFKAALYLRGVIDCPVTAPPQLPLTDNEISLVRDRLVAAGLG